MKIAILALCAALALSGALLGGGNEPVVTQEMLELINSSGGWVASDEWAKDMTVAQAQMLTKTELKELRGFPEYNWGALAEYTEIPTAFDSRTKWPGCVHPILNQGQCGSCWAFGAAESLSDRFCVASQGSQGVVDVELSPQYLVSCDFGSFGCGGGFPDEAWVYMQLVGLPTLECVPYTSGTTKMSGECPKYCKDGNDPKFYKADFIHLHFGVKSIQMAIMEGGPIETTMTVYADFMAYKSGIYEHKTGKYLGGHALKVVGWGHENGEDYWIVANSWGTDWGISGYFNIKFGQCGINFQGVSAKPNLG